MPRSQVRRTLIKSPLELWEELSDPAALARHLGEFGEIRVTSAQDQQALAWEAESLSGTIELSPSGWGTRVTLTVTAPEGEAEEQAPAPEVGTASEARPLVTAAATEPRSDAPARRRGLFGRLRRLLAGRGGSERAAPGPQPALLAPQPPPEPEAAPAPTAMAVPFAPLAQRGLHPEIWLEEIEALDLREPAVEEDPEGAPEQAPTAEGTISDGQAEAVLVAVLDRLGEAHHRPFSRS